MRIVGPLHNINNEFIIHIAQFTSKATTTKFLVNQSVIRIQPDIHRLAFNFHVVGEIVLTVLQVLQ